MSTLSVPESIFLYEDMHSLILQTQFALLHHDDKIFHQNLTQMTFILQHFFIADSQYVKDMLNTFNELNKINVNPPMPSITDSLMSLMDLQSQAINTK